MRTLERPPADRNHFAIGRLRADKAAERGADTSAGRGTAKADSPKRGKPPSDGRAIQISARRPVAAKYARRRLRVSPWKLATSLALAAPWALLAGIVAAAGWLIWSDAGPNSFAARAKSELLLASLRLGFEIEEVWVDGMQRTDRPDVLAAVGAIRGEPILEFDAAAARTRLLALPWIKDAIVARSLPSQIQVTLTERAPLALWQQSGRLQVIDREGAVINGVDPRDFGNLPILVGKGADREAATLIGLVADAPGLAQRLTAAVFVGERRWNIRIDDRIDVRLPADAPEAALARLSALQREYGLFGKDIVAIDLRLDDRLIVRLAPGAAGAPPPRNGRPS